MRSMLKQPGWNAWISLGIVFAVGLAFGMALTLPSEAAMQAPERTFPSGAALMFNPINPAKAADFERVLGRLKAAMDADPARAQQSRGWKVYKSTEQVQGNIMYIFVLDPVQSGANYAVSVILNDAFPTEVQALYEAFSGAYNGGQTAMNLERVPF